MYDTIVVAIDGSDAARAAFDAAMGLASRVSANVHVITVVEPPRSDYTFGPREVDDLNRAVEELQAETVDRYDDPSVELTQVVRRGNPTEVILSYADESNADLLVVGQRGTDGIERVLLGSTADQLARLTEVPLWIVPPAST